MHAGRHAGSFFPAMGTLWKQPPATCDSPLSRIVNGTHEPCLQRAGAFLQADNCFSFSAASEERGVRSWCNLSASAGTRTLWSAWALLGLLWQLSTCCCLQVRLLGTAQCGELHSCFVLFCFVCHKDTELKVSLQCFCPQDESVTQLGQELAQKLGLRVRKAYKRPQVWLFFSFPRDCPLTLPGLLLQKW